MTDKDAGEGKSTREEILAKAGELFARKGYFGVSMQTIASELKMTKAALYYHFPSKEKIYLNVLEETFGRLFNKLKTAAAESRNPAETLFRVINSYLNFTLENPQASLFYSSAAGEGSNAIRQVVSDIRQKMSRFFTDIFEMAEREEKQESALAAELARMLLGILANPFVWGKKEIGITARFISNLFTASTSHGS